MSPRRLLVIGGVVVLGFLLVKRQSPAELQGRLESILASAGRPLAARRFAAAKSDFDRSYFLLLAWGRQRLPPNTPGVAVVAERPVAGRRAFLAIYYLAPTPTVVRSEDIPPGWLVLIQGQRRLPGWKTIAESPLGALLAPPS